ncbi:GntR family transcriptional regulator [Actinopolymorpha pittospori]|uniref:DNA-binding GntR family transcriptional regulator n=1 Tax=Actinopolymorpha pittospori TaxID=648752 RepID=A0A927RPJ1_9ACTN|nr:GntR family transcriptional regulator [Actinopolymorpha pittospori]MBE1612181.1 DNA-binding GntR family transcriptional regulator [Actinopolymorpha pittospori]
MSLSGIVGTNRTPTAHEFVRATLRKAILDGSLPGGTRLVQTGVASELGVSTTPVREALRDLATEGLVFFDPHRGAVVRTLDINEVREIYELRATLEPLMVRRVIDRISLATLERAEALIAAMDDERRPSDWVGLNSEFHGLLTEVDDGSRLADILAKLRDSASVYISLSLDAREQQMPEANDEHRQLVKAYRAGDVEKAIDITLTHFNATLAAIEEAHRSGAI